MEIDFGPLEYSMNSKGLTLILDLYNDFNLLFPGIL